jgi:hypothetical protein
MVCLGTFYPVQRTGTFASLYLYLIIKELRFLPKFSSTLFLDRFALPPKYIILQTTIIPFQFISHLPPRQVCDAVAHSRASRSAPRERAAGPPLVLAKFPGALDLARETRGHTAMRAAVRSVSVVELFQE